MAVFSVHSYRPIGGRAADLVASMTRAGEILGAHGGAPSIWQPIAGGDAGALVFSVAYDDQQAYGRAMQAILADPVWQEFWMGVLADPSGANVENYLLADLDPTEGLPTEVSRVLYLTSFRTVPGRLADHLTAQGTARKHLERLGGRVRTVQAIGRAPSTIGTMIGFDGFEHYGEFGAKFAVDEQWATFWMGLSADPPAEQVETAVAALLEPPTA